MIAAILDGENGTGPRAREPTAVGAHLLLRTITEDIALSPLPDGVGEAARLRALSDIDSLPVGLRTEWGEVLTEMMSDVARTPDDLKWRFRRLLGCGAQQLIFGACS